MWQRFWQAFALALTLCVTLAVIAPQAQSATPACQLEDNP
jgi:hypothetical protein